MMNSDYQADSDITHLWDCLLHGHFLECRGHSLRDLLKMVAKETTFGIVTQPSFPEVRELRDVPKEVQGSISRKPRKLFVSVKPFCVCIRLKLFV